MRTICFLCGFLAGALAGATFPVAREQAPSPAIPAAGILEGWLVVRDDETVLCESPAIFVRARQIECP